METERKEKNKLTNKQTGRRLETSRETDGTQARTKEADGRRRAELAVQVSRTLCFTTSPLVADSPFTGTQSEEVS